MKKIVVMVMMALALSSLKAACMDWRFNANSADLGSSVYVILNSDGMSTEFSTFDAINGHENNLLDSSVSIAKKTTSYYATGKINNESLTLSSSYYFVLVNSEKTGYWVSDLQSADGYAYDEGNTGTLFKYDSKSARSYTTFNGGSGSGDAPGVPEPTSGLLVLVGASLLALRRKQK